MQTNISNIRNQLNVGFDRSNPKHNKLFNISVGAWATALGLTAGKATAQAGGEVFLESASQIYQAAMDQQLEKHPGLWDVVRNVDLVGLGGRSLDHFARISFEATKFPGDVIPALKEGGAVEDMASGVGSTITRAANDLAAVGGDGMGLASNMVILAGIAVAGGAALAGGSKMWRKYFVKSSDEYYELRKKLLVNGTAVRSDIDATKERAVDAYARLLAFEESGTEGRVENNHLADAREFLEEHNFGAFLEEIEDKFSQIYKERFDKRREARKQGVDPDTVGSGKRRDILREVVMDTMPDTEVVDPFESMLRPTPVGPPARSDPAP